MTIDEKAARESVLATSQEIFRCGLVEGTAGNVSARVGDERVCLTPSSTPYETMTLDDLVIVDLDGNVLDGEKGPTTEKDLHLACYRAYGEVGGVIHCHPVYASMFALVREPIPAVIEEFVVYIGGDVPICDYRTTGTAELGDEVARNLKDRAAALMANHGMVTIGKNAEKAIHAAKTVERSAKIVWGARALGKIHDIPAEVNEEFAGYYRLGREHGF